MTTASRHGLFKEQGLTQDELVDIERLATICNTYDGLDLKLNWNILRSRPLDETNDFLYYEHGTLVGFLPLFSFSLREAEISGMVHPDHRRKGIFTTLFNAARAECQRRGVADLLLIVEHSSRSGQAFAATLEPDYDHSEYKMVLEEPRILASFDERLLFRQAQPEDIPILAHITAISFDIPEQEVLNLYTAGEINNSMRQRYVALIDGICVGKIEVSFKEDEAFIFGFAVLPEYRRRGYGWLILARTIQSILAGGQQHIVLEVETKNKHALTLYQSCGFKETTSYDYYRLAAQEAE